MTAFVLEQLKLKIEKKFSTCYLDIENVITDGSHSILIPIEFHTEKNDLTRFITYLDRNALKYVSLLDSSDNLKTYISMDTRNWNGHTLRFVAEKISILILLFALGLRIWLEIRKHASF